MKRISYLIVSLMMLSGGLAFAQHEHEIGTFSVKGQLRPRAEYRHGALYPIGENYKPTSFISNRARLNLGYNNGFLSMGFGAQDVSVWGERPQIEGYPRTTGINEAWAKIGSNGYFAQMGRQQLTYDDDRILGTLDWNQAGRFHDALKLGYEDQTHKLHLILAYNQHGQQVNAGTYYAGGQPYKTMQTAWYKYDAGALNASFLLMNLGFEGGTAGSIDEPSVAKTRNMQTLGANVNYKINDLGLFGSVYYQTGKTKANNDVSAYMFAAKAQYAITSNFSAALGIDYLSGQKKDSEKVTSFDPLYGTHHKFYGTMDYFYASAFGNKGLSDIYASLIFKPVNKLTVDLTYHNFTSAQYIYENDVIQDPAVMNSGLGSEFDLTLTYPIRPYIVMQGGYSMMFGTDTFFHIKGGSKDKTQSWAFLSLNINPELFSSRSK